MVNHFLPRSSVNLPLNLFRATIANDNTRIYPYIIWYAFGPHAGKNHFWQNIHAILQDVFVAKQIVYWKTINLQNTIFQRSKNCGNLTCLNMLKVAPNMVDPTSMKQSVSRFKYPICFQPSISKYNWSQRW